MCISSIYTVDNDLTGNKFEMLRPIVMDMLIEAAYE